MIKYRVYIQGGYVEFLDLQEAQDYHAQHGVGEIEEIPIEQPQWNIELFKNQLSAAFDAKFETYWIAKDYTDMFDLLSHAANSESIYNSEALSLLQWSQENWEVAITGINEQSNIETIINNLPPYNG